VTLARIASLSLRARRVVEGVFTGLHASPHHGSSVEFAEHKEYSPGDELRHLDWRLYGKSDKLYVKRFEHETNLRATLVLDASGSMAYGDRAVSKWEYARTVAASLAYLLLGQRDAVGLAIFGDGVRRYVPPRSDRNHLSVLAEVLEATEPGGHGQAARSVDQVAERIQRRGLVVLLSDALEAPAPLAAALRRLRHRQHEVAVLHLLDVDEIEFPFDELTLFRSLEDEREVLVEPRAARHAYLQALERHCAELARECRGHEIDYVRLRTDEPVDRALVRYLGARR